MEHGETALKLPTWRLESQISCPFPFVSSPICHFFSSYYRLYLSCHLFSSSYCLLPSYCRRVPFIYLISAMKSTFYSGSCARDPTACSRVGKGARRAPAVFSEPFCCLDIVRVLKTVLEIVFAQLMTSSYEHYSSLRAAK